MALFAAIARCITLGNFFTLKIVDTFLKTKFDLESRNLYRMLLN